jgi:Spy/CpxP family protein refolding chaperone
MLSNCKSSLAERFPRFNEGAANLLPVSKTALPQKCFGVTFVVAAALLPLAALADAGSNSPHQTIMSVPSMADDFVRPSSINSGNLTQPGPGDFRYLKMNYATASDQDPTKAGASEETGPAPSPGGKASSGKQSDAVNQAPPIDKESAAPSARGDRFGRINLIPLNLTPDQKQKLQAVRRETAKKTRELSAALKSKKDELLNATFDPDQPESAIREKRDSVRAIHEQLEDLMFGDIMTLRGMLTPEQKRHLAEIKPPPNTRWGNASDTSQKQDSLKVEGTKTDGTKLSAKSDAGAKTDANKGLTSRGDAVWKTDGLKSPAMKN